ncbi:Fructosamine kinase-domain-containing protein [Sordaria sp. MPI-SDFR-AT-0083]|nr:Fructosamine kinase-domain-containing protein [Sordaria sp. MPI-SDFR-AT-0083]
MVDLYVQIITSQKLSGSRGTGSQKKKVNDDDDELKTAVERVCKLVISYLLAPERLKDAGTGEPVKPCLVHGDLWVGNTGTNTTDTGEGGGEPVIFDPAAFYTHNEYELGNWVPERCGIGGFEGEFVREYKRLYPPAEPREEFEDRVRLYSLFGLNYIFVVCFRVRMSR